MGDHDEQHEASQHPLLERAGHHELANQAQANVISGAPELTNLDAFVKSLKYKFTRNHVLKYS